MTTPPLSYDPLLQHRAVQNAYKRNSFELLKTALLAIEGDENKLLSDNFVVTALMNYAQEKKCYQIYSRLFLENGVPEANDFQMDCIDNMSDKFFRKMVKNATVLNTLSSDLTDIDILVACSRFPSRICMLLEGPNRKMNIWMSCDWLEEARDTLPKNAFAAVLSCVTEEDDILTFLNRYPEYRSVIDCERLEQIRQQQITEEQEYAAESWRLREADQREASGNHRNGCDLYTRGCCG